MDKRALLARAENLLYTREDGGKLLGVRCTVAEIESIIMYLEEDATTFMRPNGAVYDVLVQCTDLVMPREWSLR